MKYLLFVAPETILGDIDTLTTIFIQNDITYTTPNGYYWELDIPEDFISTDFETVEEQLSSLLSDYTTLDSVFAFYDAIEHWSFIKEIIYELYKTPLS